MTKRIFVPGFFTHEVAEELFTQADVELVWGLPGAGHTYDASDTRGIADPARTAQLALESELPRIHALHAMGPTGPMLVDAALMDRAPELEVIFIQAAGADAVDIDAATERGIVVLNAPGANATAVAEHAVGLMLSLARFITFSDRLVQSTGRSEAGPVYDAPVRPSILHRKALGLIGLGHVGRAVSRIARLGFGMSVRAFDPFASAAEASELGVELTTLDQVLRESDFVSLHAPLTAETRRVINAETLGMMAAHAYLINTSRGALVDTDDLVAALTARRIAGAALDVTEPEPLPQGHPLLKLDNATITPHIASLCIESQRDTARISTELVLAALSGDRPERMMNPEVWPRARANRSR